MRRLALVACLLVALLSASAGSALAMPHVKRHAKACKQRKPAARTSTAARPTPIRAGETRRRAAIRRSQRKRRRCAKAKARRRAAPPAPGAPSPPATAPPGSSPPGSTMPAPEPGGDPTTPVPPWNPFAVQVRSGEFFLQLSKPEVHAGNVRVEFNNSTAEDPHDLHVVRFDGTGAAYSFGELQSGEVEAKTLRLNAGSWRLFCALPAHAERGMTVNLRVVAG